MAYSQGAPLNKIATEKAESNFGQAFCIFEVLEYKLTGVKATIFSTDHVSDCKYSEFERLSSASISAQLQTFMRPAQIIKSGSHNPVMSKDLSPLREPYIEVGQLKFRKSGEIFINYLEHFYKFFTNLSYRNGYVGSSYTPLKVTTDVYFLYNSGLRVYELLSPDGKTFTMTSFTSFLNPELNADVLKDMGPSLELPKGWSFSTRILDKQVSIRSRANFFEAELIYDNFGNFYIRTQ